MGAWNQNRLTAELGIDYPIIQGPLGGLSSQRLTAAVSNFGGLGSFGAPRPVYEPYSPKRFEDQARVLLDAQVPAFSFIYGIPPKDVLDECRHRGIATIGTATTVDEAVALEEAGVDVVASGFEAGGHRGSFLRPSEESLIGTMALVPQVVDAVKLPVVAAGGIADARGIVAAFALGVSGVQMGTVFLSCEESSASPTTAKLFSPARQARQL
jgi:nitronate monooxygenase